MMGRTPRFVAPNRAYHVVHRGHDREPVFLSEEDFQFYLENLRGLKTEYACTVYAYCLMLNCVHLLVEIGEDPATLSRLMKSLGARQTRYVSRKYGRSGALWQGRYRSIPVPEELILPVACHIERTPVRIHLAQEPQRYPWSSCRQRLGQEACWIDLEAAYLALAPTPELRTSRYHSYLAARMTVPEREHFRRVFGAGAPDIDCDYADVVAVRQRGRPRRAATGRAQDKKRRSSALDKER